MTKFLRYIFTLFSVLLSLAAVSQSPDSVGILSDSVEEISDSMRIVLLNQQLEEARHTEMSLRLEMQHLSEENATDSLRKARIRQRIDSLKTTTAGMPVVVEEDTLFTLYAKQSGLSPQARAELVSKNILRLGKSLNLQPDSVKITEAEFEIDILYGNDIIMSVTQLDALWANSEPMALAEETRQIIVDELAKLKQQYSLWQFVKRTASVIGVLILLFVLFKLINKGYHWLVNYIDRLKETRLKPLYIQKVELLDVNKQHKLLAVCAKLLKWAAMLIVVVLVVPLVFSIFPQTKDLANDILLRIWNPVHSMLMAIINYIPNLFTIFVICIVIKYLVRLLKYFAHEISEERIKFNGFFSDWAMPTFYIIRFLLYAFMIAMIYPYLPGSNSGVFQGISVFVGLIVSIGSSSVIGNLIAGLVITYMRPFKMGDRIEIKDVVGDVIEKNPFVTRILTPKNEIVTMPNSFIMSSQTVNYSQSARDFGLIIHTNVNIGYEVPWKKVNDLLIEAAIRTKGVVLDPKPFVLLTELGDYYPVYQINAYIRQSDLLPDVYSYLHESIIEVFSREGIEVLSPHYVSTRDGNASTVPQCEFMKAEKEA